MKILLHALNFAPEELGCGKYSGEMVHDLVGSGHRCAVVTTPPYYPQWRIWEGYGGWRYRRETIVRDRVGAVDVIRCPLWVPKKVTGLKRVLHLASFGLSSAPAVLWNALRRRPDVIMTIEPTAFCMPATLLAARLTGAKTWLHVQDFEVDAAFDLGILNLRLLRRAILACESFLMKRFDRVSTISPNMLLKLQEKGVSTPRTSLLPNWVDCDEMRPLWAPGTPSAARTEARRCFGIQEDAFVALYAGSIGDKQGMEILVEAARLLQTGTEAAVRIVVCGNGSGHSRLAALSSGLANFQMLPVQPSERFNDLMNCADVHLLPQKAGAADLVMPSKLTGMLATGRPVVACADDGTQIASVVQGRGVVAPPDEPKRFAEAIQSLAADSERCRALGIAARRYAVENLSRQSILAKFENELRELADKRAPMPADTPISTPPQTSKEDPAGQLVRRPHFGSKQSVPIDAVEGKDA